MSQCNLSKEIEHIWAEEKLHLQPVGTAKENTVVHSWVNSWLFRRLKDAMAPKAPVGSLPPEKVLHAIDDEWNLFEHHVMSDEDLPNPGLLGTVYKVTSTGDMYIWGNGKYQEYNPYAPAGEQLTECRQLLVDYSADMLHGGKGALAIIYNIHALKRDLAEKEKRSWTWGDMLPRGIISKTDSEQTQRDKYLKHSHAKLVEQMRDVLRARPMEEKDGRFDRARKELQTKLEGLGVNTYTTGGGFGIAIGTFVANF
jgi:hypothetical protein